MTALCPGRCTASTSLGDMIIRPALHLLALALAALSAVAHRIEIDPGQRQCYFETLQPNDKVS